MDLQATWRKPANVLVREVGGEAVLLDLDTEKYFGLDEIGTIVLREVEAGSTLAQTIATIVESYDASEDVVRTDVENLVTALVERGLLHVVDNG